MIKIMLINLTIFKVEQIHFMLYIFVRKKYDSCQRPYHIEHTSSRPITEVKQRRAWLVLGWVTAWEHHVLQTHLFHFICFVLLFSRFCNLLPLVKLLLCSDVSLSFYQSYFIQSFNIIIVQIMNVLSTIFLCFYIMIMCLKPLRQPGPPPIPHLGGKGTVIYEAVMCPKSRGGTFKSQHHAQRVWRSLVIVVLVLEQVCSVCLQEQLQK